MYSYATQHALKTSAHSSACHLIWVCILSSRFVGLPRVLNCRQDHVNANFSSCVLQRLPLVLLAVACVILAGLLLQRFEKKPPSWCVPFVQEETFEHRRPSAQVSRHVYLPAFALVLLAVAATVAQAWLCWTSQARSVHALSSPLAWVSPDEIPNMEKFTSDVK